LIKTQKAVISYILNTLEYMGAIERKEVIVVERKATSATLDIEGRRYTIVIRAHK